MTIRDNRGALFKNDRKESDTHPDYRGSLNVDGEEFWLNAWICESKNGVKYMSLSIKPRKAAANGAPKTNGVPFDDEIPF